ncbi:MAG TPA: 2-oxo-4-hydroxy-4-carboxy-5-ureidoimidazoline decarboxylase [Terriglobia bacterium]|nr:2-oxo-4-hydroxy-4-carboxy-5-ureidoimidazoline decarboxylase [Terriglobia bacterium]
MADAEARAALGECCGSTAWAHEIVVRRPFRSESHLLDAADETWQRLTETDWRQAFASHPQIGAALGAARTGGDGVHARWSQREQAGMENAGEATRQAIADGNCVYREKFGYIYIVCATGKSSDEMLAILTERLQNDAASEIRVAATEQSKITRLRLQKMLAPE